MTTDNFCFYLQNRPAQTSQTGGQWCSDSFPFSTPWVEQSTHDPKIEGLSPATADTGRVKIGNNYIQFCCLKRYFLVSDVC
jgi:hypothetical protein